jgi:hypothetical protein
MAARERRQRSRRHRGTVGGSSESVGRPRGSIDRQRDGALGLRGRASSEATGESGAAPGASQREVTDPAMTEARVGVRPGAWSVIASPPRHRVSGVDPCIRPRRRSCSASDGATRAQCAAGVPKRSRCLGIVGVTASRSSKDAHHQKCVPGERHEGNGRSDAVRLSARNESSKGVNASTGTSPVRSVRSSGRGSRWWPKRGEPHIRHRDATSPGSRDRRKPSRGCETPRAERDASVWQPMPEGVGLGRLREWTVVASQSPWRDRPDPLGLPSYNSGWSWR